MEGYYIKKVGQNKGKPRVWLERTQVSRAGFEAGMKYDVLVDGQTIVLQANKDGSRVVSAKKDGDAINPVIDLNSKELLAIFDGMAAVRVVPRDGQIYILPLASEIKKRERFNRLKQKLENGEPLDMGSLSHGGGVLSHAIHSGLAAANIPTRLRFANEIREELLEHAAARNDAWDERTMPLSAPMQELAFDQRGLAHIPKTEILEFGLPCSGASRAGKSSRHLAHAEAHPEVGHLIVSALIILNQTNAAIIIGENVPEYATSASADIIRNQLSDMGYVLHERILNGVEWGTLENRNRWCMVAVTEGIEFDFDQLIPPPKQQLRIRDILDPDIADDDPRWRTFSYLKEKEVRDKENGKSFGMQIVEADDDLVPTLRKGYAKGGSTDALLRHPTKPDLLRQFTPEEHARIKSVPQHLIEGLSATIAHQVLGQSIVYPPFRDVGKHVGQSLQRFVGREPVTASKARMQSAEFALPSLGKSDDSGVSIDRLLKEVGGKEQKVDSQRGRYSGQVVAVERDVILQDVGKNETAVHKRSALDRQPRLGKSVSIEYSNGKAKVKSHDKQQMSLEL